MAEIEYFMDLEEDKRHTRFDEVRDMKLRLLGRDSQLSENADSVTIPIGQAVNSGLVDNETLGYFITTSFFPENWTRSTEVTLPTAYGPRNARYAADCWDAELPTS